jgi:hypothetical protein
MTNQYHPGQTAQAIELQPKPAHAYRKVWRRIRDNGFDVIPLRGRDGPFRGWPRQPNDDAAIATWRGKTAGIRMFGSSCFVIDLDVRSDRVRAALMEMLWQHWPKFMKSCLRRRSGSTTLALIGRVSTARKRSWTVRFKPEPGIGDKPHLVEYFTGNDKRYVGVHGWHSPGREYDYVGPHNILNTRIDALPWFPEDDIPKMIIECERVMRELGLEQIKITHVQLPGERVYDLKPDDVMTLSDGEQIKLSELEKRAGAARIKGYATIWDRESKTRDRVLVNRSGAAGLTLWDTKTGLSHRWASLSPAEDPELQQQLRELMADVKHPWEGGR